MIFLTLGSQKFQFNRLLEEVDKLINDGVITDKVFAQIGSSNYKPKYFEYVDFISQEDFIKKMDECDIVITHAGTGAIVNAIKKNKKVIAVPRLAKYGEHVDDHQIQIIDEFKQLNLIEPVYELEDLGKKIEIVKFKEYDKYISNTDAIIKSIEEYIERG